MPPVGFIPGALAEIACLAKNLKIVKIERKVRVFCAGFYMYHVHNTIRVLTARALSNTGLQNLVPDRKPGAAFEEVPARGICLL